MPCVRAYLTLRERLAAVLVGIVPQFPEEENLRVATGTKIVDTPLESGKPFVALQKEAQLYASSQAPT